MNEPLKGKFVFGDCKEFDEYHKKVFEYEDVAGAVKWLKKELMRSASGTVHPWIEIGASECMQKVDEAFEGVIDNE